MSVLAEVDPAVAYPETVPEMAESGLHWQVRIQTYIALRDHFAGHPDCFVCSERNLYYRPQPNTAFVVPDLFVSFGVDPGALELDFSYRLWDAGAPPAFVLEIASEKTHNSDLNVKPAVYLEVGVGEYWRLDPTGGDYYTPALQGDRRAGDAWAPIAVDRDGDGRLRGHSAVLGLDLHAEPHRLRLRDPQTGLWLPDHDETRRQRDATEAEVAALRARLNDQTGDTAQ